MTLPTNIQELKKICVYAGCTKRRKKGKHLCSYHQSLYGQRAEHAVKESERKANAIPKAPDPRYKDLS